MSDSIKLFALGATRPFGEQMAERLGIALAAHEERQFEDGEHKARPLESVRGCDVFVVHSLYSDGEQSVNDKLCRLLFFLGAVRDASAERVTAVIPYLCYARKDRKTKTRDPLTTRYVATMIESVGVDRVVVLEAHNVAAFQNAFRCRTEHLELRRLLVDYFAPWLGDEPVAVVSPDVGGVKRADAFRQDLAAALGRDVAGAFLEKRRSEGVVSGDAVVGDVEGRTAVVIDDLVSSGTTMARAAHACRERGAGAVYAAAAHGLFVHGANDVVADEAIDRVLVSDTIPPFRLEPALVERKVDLLDAAGLFADAVWAVHTGGSVAALMERKTQEKR